MKAKYKSVFISDTHLGTRGCKEEELLSFLKSFEADNLFLVGDIIDGWAMHRRHYWSTPQTEILRRILKLSEKLNVYYIAGNHDEFIRPFFKYDFQFGRCQILDSFNYTGLDGRSYYVTHGDHFDFWMRIPRQVINLFAHFTDLPIKAAQMGKNPARYLRVTNVEKALRRYAKFKKYDCIICGHTHHPKLTDGFMNTGDWVKNCTALIEHLDGTWELLYYGKETINASSEASSTVGETSQGRSKAKR